MYGYVTVRRQTDDLNAQEWRFSLQYDKLILDSYITFRRESRRHKFKLIDRYSRLDKRMSSIESNSVSIPDGIATEAKAILKSQIDEIMVTM